MKYKTAPGVVLTEICGQYLLVAARKKPGLAPRVRQINETAAFLWRQMAEAASVEDLKTALLNEYEIPDPAPLEGEIRALVDGLCELGCLLSTEEEA